MLVRSLAAAGALVIATTACASGAADDGPPAASGAAAPVAVTIKDFKYAPPSVTLSVGQSVTWSNEDFFGHTVTSGTPGQPDPAAFDGVLGEVADAAGQTFTTTFEQPGTYPYFCRFHPTMLGEVVVSA